MEFTHWGYLLSRKISKNTKLSEQTIYPFDISGTTIKFSDLATNLKDQVDNILRQNEVKMSFVVEGMFLFNINHDIVKTKFVNKAKIVPEYYPECAITLLKKKILTKEDIFRNIKIDYIDYWYSDRLKDESNKELVIIEGESGSNGVGVGIAVFNKEEVRKLINENKSVIWIAESVSPDDLNLLKKVEGVILTKAGASSHASILIKNLGLPFILSKDIQEISNGQEITIDANTGTVFKDRLQVVNGHRDDYLENLTNLALEMSPVTVAANANSEEDIVNANNNGGTGIALCRTEHMFLENSKINLIRELILTDKEPSSGCTEDLVDMQYKDFIEVFRHLDKSEIVIRFLDLPLYELMPDSIEEHESFAKYAGLDKQSVVKKIKKFKESNSMMGYRAARFLIRNPFFVSLQTKAILKAVKSLQSEGITIRIGFELPLISTVQEFVRFKELVEAQIKISYPEFTNYFYAAMIETPRACFISDKIAKHVDMISFGTNDLTQFTFAFSRDDTDSFLPDYIDENIIGDNPFEVLDKVGVGELIKLSISRARSINPDIEVSICGEQAVDFETIEFLMNVGVDKIGCNSYSIPKVLFSCARLSVS